MNALAATGIAANESGILAALTLPQSAAAIPDQGFINLIHMLLGSLGSDSESISSEVSDSSPFPEAVAQTATQSNTTSQATSQGPAHNASSSQIADALIRAMLGGVSASTVLQTTNTPPQEDRSSASGSTSTDDCAAQDTSTTVADGPVQILSPTTSMGPQQRKALRNSSNPSPSDSSLEQIALGQIAAMSPPKVIVPQTMAATSGDSSNPSSLISMPDRRVQTGAIAPTNNSPASRAISNKDIAFQAILTPLEDISSTSQAIISHATSDTKQSIQETTAVEPLDTQPVTASPQALAAAQSQTAGQQTQAQPQQIDQGDAPNPKKSIAAEPKPKPAASDNPNDDSPHVTAAVASTQDAALNTRGDFAAPTENRTPAIAAHSDNTSAPDTPFPSTAETLRTSEPIPSASIARAASAQQISVRIAPPDTAPVDLRVVDRAGQLHVDVRTQDPALQSSLRENLGTLTNSLERAGYHAETFTPAAVAATRAAASSQMSNQDNSQDSQTGDRQNAQSGSQGRNGSGDSSDGRQQQQQKRGQRAQSWLEELENQQ